MVPELKYILKIAEDKKNFSEKFLKKNSIPYL